MPLMINHNMAEDAWAAIKGSYQTAEDIQNEFGVSRATAYRWMQHAPFIHNMRVECHDPVDEQVRVTLRFLCVARGSLPAPGLPGNPAWHDSETQRQNARKRWRRYEE